MRLSTCQATIVRLTHSPTLYYLFVFHSDVPVKLTLSLVYKYELLRYTHLSPNIRELPR